MSAAFTNSPDATPPSCCYRREASRRAQACAIERTCPLHSRHLSFNPPTNSILSAVAFARALSKLIYNYTIPVLLNVYSNKACMCVHDRTRSPSSVSLLSTPFVPFCLPFPSLTPSHVFARLASLQTATPCVVQ
jgi:hypothetical protein